MSAKKDNAGTELGNEEFSVNIEEMRRPIVNSLDKVPARMSFFCCCCTRKCPTTQENPRLLPRRHQLCVEISL
jgi:hypothetical protein